MSDVVNHPSHYESQRIVLEPIDLCECYDFCIGNALKYLIRAGRKEGNPIAQDLAKARWYLERASDECQYYYPPICDSRIKVAFMAQAYSADNIFLRELFRGAEDGCVICAPEVRECIDLLDRAIGEAKGWQGIQVSPENAKETGDE